MATRDVRAIGSLQDFDGLPVNIGVDHDLITIDAPAGARLDSRAAAELHALWAAATVATDTYKAGTEAGDA